MSMLLLALNYLSWCLLCLGLERHYKLHFGAAPDATSRRLLRSSGWLLTAMAFAWALRHGDLAIVTWAASWMLAALAWTLLQTYRPALARYAAPTLFGLAWLIQVR